jgi:hypothetical protein
VTHASNQTQAAVECRSVAEFGPPTAASRDARAGVTAQQGTSDADSIVVLMRVVASEGRVGNYGSASSPVWEVVMSEWLGFAAVVAAIGGVFWLGLRLLRQAQRSDPGGRQDSSEPGVLYSDSADGTD